MTDGSGGSPNSSAYLNRGASGRHPRVSVPRFRRHWGISAKTRYVLGWCDANIGVLREAPVLPEVRRALLDDAVTRATAATTALAGSTLSADEVAEILAGRRRPRSQRRLAVELRNAARAMEMLLGSKPLGRTLSPGLLLKLHKIVGANLGRRFGGTPGEFRTNRGTNGDAGAPFPCPPASRVPGLVKELCEWLEREFPPTPWPAAVLSPTATASPTESGQRFVDGFVHAAASHLYLLWTRPFADGNGRTARLAESCNLLRAGVPGLACHLLPEHYADTRQEYDRRVRRAVEDRSLTSFVAYAAEGFADGLAGLVRALRRPQLETAWRRFVFQRFAEVEHRKKSVFRRRRALALAASLDDPLAPEDLARLDPDLAREYGRLSERTLLRDLRVLVEAGLMAESDDDRFRARTDVLVEARPRPTR